MTGAVGKTPIFMFTCLGVSTGYGAICRSAPANRHQVERPLTGVHIHDLFHTLIVKCSHDNGAKAERDCLQKYILRGVADFDVDVADAPAPVLPGCALLYGREHQKGCISLHPTLPMRSRRQLIALVYLCD